MRSVRDLRERMLYQCKKVVGEDYTVDELLKEILKDKSFYDSCGVTFSGGEPLVQSAFLKEILTACRKTVYIQP